MLDLALAHLATCQNHSKKNDDQSKEDHEKKENTIMVMKLVFIILYFVLIAFAVRSAMINRPRSDTYVADIGFAWFTPIAYFILRAFRAIGPA